MSLSEAEKTEVSRTLVRAMKSLREARDHSQKAEVHIQERHLKDARRAHLNAANGVTSASNDLEALRKLLNLEDPIVIKKKEFVERANKIKRDLEASKARYKMILESGETDPHMLSAVDSVVKRYESALASLGGEMALEGFSAVDINVILGFAA